MSKTATLFIISAPSGCGKTTIVNEILRKVKGIKRSVSATTRKPRKREVSNKDYYFISEKAFKKKAEKGVFLEWAKNFGHYYGTPKGKVIKELKAGRDIILTIDVKGAAQVKKKIPSSVMIFVSPLKLKDLRRRLKKRARDTAKDVSRRMAVAKKEMALAGKYDYLVVNDRFEKAVENVKSIITAKRCEISKKRDKEKGVIN